MGSLSNAIARARALQADATEDAFGDTVTINGVGYLCAVIPGGRKIIELTLGFREVELLTVRVRKSLLPACPEKGSPIAWGGKTWRIEETQGRLIGAIVWTLTCHRDA